MQRIVGLRHLEWIVAAAALGFGASFVLFDLLRLPAPVYHLGYIVLIGAFVALYARATRLDLGAVLRPRLLLAVVLGVLGGLVLMRRVLADSASTGPAGVAFAWDLAWRGLVYGAVDGVLLSAFPWTVVWRALRGESASRTGRMQIGGLALASTLLVTSAYHLGYPDFRGAKVVQANIGNVIATLPTLLARNPVASPIAHAMLHLTAVAHNPRSELFLPPHAP